MVEGRTPGRRFGANVARISRGWCGVLSFLTAIDRELNGAEKELGEGKRREGNGCVE